MKPLTSAIVFTAILVPMVTAAQQPEIATAMAFTEGPTVDRDGNVYFTELVFQRIMKLDPKGVLTVFRENSNNANGLLIDPQGRLIACEGADSARMGVPQKFKPQVTRTDLATGRSKSLPITTRASHSSGRTMSRSTRKAACISPTFPVAPCTDWMLQAG